MLIGAHVILFSRDADADRAFLRKVLGLGGVDAGQGWLLFALPPGEVAVHPGDVNDVHQLYLQTDDVRAEMRTLAQRGVRCGPLSDQRWGLITRVPLPGGGSLGLYQPKHPRPQPATQRRPAPRTRPSPARRRPGAGTPVKRRAGAKRPTP